MQPTSSSAQAKWDGKYRNKTSQPKSSPPSFLALHYQKLKQGRVLDIACGDGAASLFLAEQGNEVCGVDISPVGLTRLTEQAEKQGLAITTAIADLETEHPDLSDLGQFDSIVISRYKPSKHLWQHLTDLIVEDGRVLLTAFNLQHHERTGFSARFCMTPKEFENTNTELELIYYEEDLHGEGMDGYLLKKSD